MNFAIVKIISLLLALTIALTHLSVVYLAKIDKDKQKIITSIGGGISIAYIFLHLLPELALKGKHNIESLNISSEFLEVSFFLVALLGLLILFVVDALSETSKIPKENNFKLHLIYNISITYLYAFTLPEVVKEGLFYSILYTFTLSAHVFSSDRVIFRFHEIFYKSKYRWIGFSAVLLGVLHSLTFEYIYSIQLDYAFAFLSGGVLLNTFLEELPKKNILNVKWFLSAIMLTSTSILITTFIKN